MKTESPEIRWWLHGGLFFAALATAFLAGMAFAGGDPWSLDSWSDAALVGGAALYALPVMTILFAHEMGHYLYCRRFGVDATPPFFIPGIPIPGYAVLPFIGTFGAFIRMNVKPMKAGELLRIGAWGPIAGFLVTVPVLFVGFAMSEIKPLPEDLESAIVLGDSLLLLLGEALFHPEIPEGHDVFLHPLGMAGWVGVFLTALNLMPVGQLDGGHICYSVLGERYNRVAHFLFGGMILLGIFAFMGWFVIAALVWKLGIKHPPIMRGEPARGRDAWPAWASFAIMVLTFAPAPIEGASLLSLLSTW